MPWYYLAAILLLVGTTGCQQFEVRSSLYAEYERYGLKGGTRVECERRQP